MCEEEIKLLKHKMYWLFWTSIIIFVSGMAIISKLVLEFAQYLDDVLKIQGLM